MHHLSGNSVISAEDVCSPSHISATDQTTGETTAINSVVFTKRFEIFNRKAALSPHVNQCCIISQAISAEGIIVANYYMAHAKTITEKGPHKCLCRNLRKCRGKFYHRETIDAGPFDQHHLL